MSCDATGNDRAAGIDLFKPSGGFLTLKSCSPTGTVTVGPLTESGDFRIQFVFDKDGVGKAALSVTSVD